MRGLFGIRTARKSIGLWHISPFQGYSYGVWARLARAALKGRHTLTMGAAHRNHKRAPLIHRAAPYVGIYRPFRACQTSQFV